MDYRYFSIWIIACFLTCCHTPSEENPANNAIYQAMSIQAHWNENSQHSNIITLPFASDTTLVSPVNKSTIKQQLQTWSNDLTKPHYLVIIGHSYMHRAREINMALGWQRAIALKRTLIKLGQNASTIITLSHGQERPLLPGHNKVSGKFTPQASIILINQ